MSNLLDNLILSPPNDLCFNSHEFIKESFSVDQFLQEHRNLANLETMRDDLGVYLKTLRSAMIELINKDYADFVNLSSNLIGLDKAITSIQLPLGQLKEELLIVQKNIEDALNEVTAQLLRRKNIQERKRSLKSVNRVHCSLKKLSGLLDGMSGEGDESESQLVELERAAMEFNQLKFHESRCTDDLSDVDKQAIGEIERTLCKYLDEHFVGCLENKKEEELFRVLSIYLALDKSSQAELCYRKKKVSLVMSRLISEETLTSNPRGLVGLYDSLIAFITNEMKILCSATSSSDKLGKVKGFDFLVNSFWPEVEERLELNLSSIYAPGNPDHFFMCYRDTQQFLASLESRCDKKALREHPQYHSFMLRWNLPVYFQIRFQEIAGAVESALVSTEGEGRDSAEWRLRATSEVWRSLLHCWADKVFIPQLTHRFWKLNLQILGRYNSWTHELLSKKSEDGWETWVSLYTDLAALAGRLGELFSVACEQLHPSVTPSIRTQLQKCMEEGRQQLVGQLGAVSGRLVRSVSAASLKALRQVSEVPRLYRRTNREAPARSLPYVDAMLEAPLSFHASHLDHPQVLAWLQSVFSDVSKQYYVAVMDVLTSVQKTEESLRRLKKIRDRSSATGSTPDRGGDDDKIRMQLYFDANYYCNKIEEVGIKKEIIDQLNDLLKLVETLHSKK